MLERTTKNNTILRQISNRAAIGSKYVILSNERHLFLNELKPRIHDEQTGLDYILAGDYYIPDIELLGDNDHPVGKWGRMHRLYLAEANPFLLNYLILTGKLHTYFADLNEQAQDRYRLIVRQMADADGVTEDLKRRSQLKWIKAMNSIASRAEEIIKSEMIYA